MNNTKLKKMIMAALFAAMTCAATMLIRIPTPGTGGYIHPGDAIVILCGIILGPIYGGFAAGLGSMFADLAGGYLIYAPATLFIKGISACLIGLVFHHLAFNTKKQYGRVIVCGTIHTILIPLLYFFFEVVLYGSKGAFVSVIPNIIQAGGGAVIAFVLYPLLTAIPDIRKVITGSKRL